MTIHRCSKPLWCVTLAAFLTGCAGWRQVELLPANGAAASGDSLATAEVGTGPSRLVQDGMAVRVTMRDGVRHEGTVLSHASGHLVLDSDDSDGPQVMLPVREIARIEARPGRMGPGEAGIAVVGVAVGILTVLVLLISFSDIRGLD